MMISCSIPIVFDLNYDLISLKMCFKYTVLALYKKYQREFHESDFTVPCSLMKIMLKLLNL